jgi:transcriptional regulator with XRE-family HTH domain
MGEAWSWSDVGGRVRTARIAAGLSQGELAGRLDLDRTMIVKIESGDRRIDALELAKLAEVLGLPLGHFLSRAPAVLSHRAELSDDTTSVVARESYQLDAILEGWLRDIQQLMELGVLAVREQLSYREPVDSPEAARAAALWTRSRLGYQPVEPVGSLMDACERAGQFVSVVEAPGDGASLVDGAVAAAVISRHADPGRRRATAAHELGHMILGDEYSSDLGVNASREERESIIDNFAAELLLPLDAVKPECSNGRITRESLVKLAGTYRVSWTLAVSQAQYLAAVSSALRHRRPTKAELLDATGWAPQPDFESVRVPPSFAEAVMKAWRRSLITSTRAVELMRGHIALEDLPDREEPEPEP